MDREQDGTTEIERVHIYSASQQERRQINSSQFKTRIKQVTENM